MSEIPDIYSSWLAGCFSVINKLNPLCIVTASDLTVIFLGPAHQKTATGLKVGFPVYDSLKICRPSYLKLDELSLPSLVGKRLVLAPVSQGSWRLQAELIRFSADAYLFACRPVIADVSTISDLGLSFGDLGVCDGTMELIQLMKMTELAREDMSEIVSRLEQTQYRISAALEGSNDGWWQWNLEDKTAFLSPKLQELLGISDRNPE